MANTQTFVGNLTADPVLRYTPNGNAVANLRLADTPRHKDASGQWVDGETLYQDATVWGKAAENVAESLTKGTRVLVVGTVKARSFTTRDGEKRNTTEIAVDFIGPELSFATATVTRNPRGNGGNSRPAASAPVAQDDFSDEPPF